jgi:hypothetical protein
MVICTMTTERRRRFLPPNFPSPDDETLEKLRRNVMERTSTPYRPDEGELAALVCADEAGVDLSEIDAAEVWLMTPAEREPFFTLIAGLLGEIAGP